MILLTPLWILEEAMGAHLSPPAKLAVIGHQLEAMI